MAVRTRPISFSVAEMTESPSSRRMRPASNSTAPEISIATHSAPTHSISRPGWRDESSSTVAIADGPASSGTASGKISGSRPGSRP